MIVSCKGDVAINGNRDDVYAELGCICRSLLKNGFSKVELAEAIIIAETINKEEGVENGKSNS